MASVLDNELDEAELVALARQLVRIPSPQTELMEAEPAVQDFLGACAEILAARGLEGRRDRMGNLLIEVGPSSAAIWSNVKSEVRSAGVAWPSRRAR
jgi:hypothetical protein